MRLEKGYFSDESPDPAFLVDDCFEAEANAEGANNKDGDEHGEERSAGGVWNDSVGHGEECLQSMLVQRAKASTPKKALRL